MTDSGFAWSTEVAQADWIGPRLSAFGRDRADSVVPAGFEAYARLLHPVWRTHRDHDELVRWSDVAAWSGVPLDEHAQFQDIALPRHTPGAAPPWDSQGPKEGTLAEQDARVLVELLQQHTGQQQCWFCLWEGYGGVGTRHHTCETEPQHHQETDPETVRSRARSGPLVRLPAREYLLYTGDVTAALAFVDSREQTPNLWWPQDRSWCVASEIDLPWTYLAGPPSLIEAVLAEPRLEALRAHTDDPTKFRVPAWLGELVDNAAAELAERGTVTVTTSVGCVYAWLRRPKRWRKGWLHISSRTDSGGGPGTTAKIPFCSEAELRHQLRESLQRTVIHLVAE